AATLAGHLQLANLCWIYDNNKITIEGHTDWAFSEDVATRFIAYRWNVTRVGDANDLDMLRRAFRTFHATTDRPTLIIVDSHIAYGAPNKQDTSAAHGEPLGEEEIRLTKRTYDWPADAKGLAGRDASAQVLNALGRNVPWLIGGSADLAPSTKTRLTLPDAGDLTAETPGGRNLHFGIREHAMGAVLNGLSLSKVRA